MTVPLRPASVPDRDGRTETGESVRRRSTAPGHLHLWVLPDGTLAHAPPGRLSRNGEGLLACHLCGRWFIHLGAHLRRHGWTAEQYRDAVGLTRGEPLCSTELSVHIAARQKNGWESDRAVRARLDVGHELARSGELARRAAEAAGERDRAGGSSAAMREVRTRSLAAGRATAAARRQAHLDAVLVAAGAGDLHDFLRHHYAGGASLDALSRRAGLGRARLRTELTAAGVGVRRSGVNNPASKHARAHNIDAQVAARVGAKDIRVWLRSQRANGTTIQALARQTQRSIPWIQSRLASQRAQHPDRQ